MQGGLGRPHHDNNPETEHSRTKHRKQKHVKHTIAVLGRKKVVHGVYWVGDPNQEILGWAKDSCSEKLSEGSKQE